MNTSVDGLWAAYVTRFGEGMTQRQIGEKAGVDQATAGRWVRGEKVPTEAAVVARLAQGFGRNPLEAFVAAGFLSLDEVGRGLEKESADLLRTMMKSIEARQEASRDALRLRQIIREAGETLAAAQERGEVLGEKSLAAAVNLARAGRGEEPLADVPMQVDVQALISTMIRLAERANVSEASATIPDAIAALEDESIAGEQESRHDT